MSRVPLAVVSLVTALAVSACGSSSGPTERADAPVPWPSHPRTSAAAPSPAPTATTSPTDTATRHGGRHKVGTLAPRTRGAADDHLLDADRLPTVGGRAWTLDGTPAEGAVGACQKTDLATIGAVDAVTRTYTAADGVTATQVVARFADAKSAWRAHRVLTAWRDDCETRVARADIGPLEPIRVHTGTADSYRGSFRTRAAGLGILRSGDYLSLVEVAASADRYPSSWDPARKAVRRIARTF